MKFNIITIFPKIISDYCDETILARAQKEKIISVNSVNLRDFTTDKHKTVDDTPYGGGAGMVLKPEPIYRALKKLKALKKKSVRRTSRKSKVKNPKSLTILLSPRGRQFDQRVAEQWAKLKEITFVCGRYEGVDQRVSDHMVDEEISVGPYVLAGGELAALVIIEAVARLIPGVLGNEASLAEETFGRPLSAISYQLSAGHHTTNAESRVEYPQYTKPADFMGWKVPDVLLSGNHKKIAEWRQK